MPINVQRRRRDAVPEALLHRIEIDAACEHQRAGGMAQIVQTPVWQALIFELCEDAPEGVGKRVGMQWSADLIGEDMIARFPKSAGFHFAFRALLTLQFQRGQRKITQRNLPRSPCCSARASA